MRQQVVSGTDQVMDPSSLLLKVQKLENQGPNPMMGGLQD